MTSRLNGNREAAKTVQTFLDEYLENNVRAV
jgi:hypothetical protein